MASDIHAVGMGGARVENRRGSRHAADAMSEALCNSKHFSMIRFICTVVGRIVRFDSRTRAIILLDLLVPTSNSLDLLDVA